MPATIKKAHMKTLSRIIFISGFAALAACGGGNNDSNVAVSAENQADALENEANALEAKADEAINQAINGIEDQGETLQNQAEDIGKNIQ
jgi:hypothetical protein